MRGAIALLLPILLIAVVAIALYGVLFDLTPIEHLEKLALSSFPPLSGRSARSWGSTFSNSHAVAPDKGERLLAAPHPSPPGTLAEPTPTP
jgi:hypothetical protein